MSLPSSPAPLHSHRGWVEETVRCFTSSRMGLISMYLPESGLLTLSAVSPTARVYSEFVDGVIFHPLHPTHVHIMRLDSGAIVHTLRPSPRWKVEDTMPTEWWIERCGLDLAVDCDCYNKGIHLTRPFFRRMKYMWHCQNLKTVTLSAAYEVGLYEMSVSNALFADLSTRYPARLASLQSLFLHGSETKGLEHVDKLRHLTNLRLRGNLRTLDMSRFASAGQLSYVQFITPHLLRLEGLHLCMSLREVFFCLCKGLTDLSACGDAPALEVVTVYGGGLSDITGLSRCRQLRNVTLHGCCSLKDVSPLAGLPLLTLLDISGSGVQSIAGLGRCHSLQRVELATCHQLQDLSPLSGAPALTVIDANDSGAAVLTGLNQCKSLELVNFDSCFSLHTLAPLAGAPRLKVVTARDSGLRFAFLREMCPRLTNVDLQGCEYLTPFVTG